MFPGACAAFTISVQQAFGLKEVHNVLSQCALHQKVRIVLDGATLCREPLSQHKFGRIAATPEAGVCTESSKCEGRGGVPIGANGFSTPEVPMLRQAPRQMHVFFEER